MLLTDILALHTNVVEELLFKYLMLSKTLLSIIFIIRKLWGTDFTIPSCWCHWRRELFPLISINKSRADQKTLLDARKLWIFSFTKAFVLSTFRFSDILCMHLWFQSPNLLCTGEVTSGIASTLYWGPSLLIQAN